VFCLTTSMACRSGSTKSRPGYWPGTRPARLSRRLASAPGVGPLTATAIVAAVGDSRQFKSARHFAARLGLTPRIQASRGKEHIGRISKGYLRTMLIHGARAVVGTAFRIDVRPKAMAEVLLRRWPVNVAATAVAHKTARSLWAMLTRAELYRPRVTVVPAA
jgi:transposase